MAEVTKGQIEQWLETEEPEFQVDKFRQKHDISPVSSNFYRALNLLVAEKRIKRVGRGIYRQIEPIPNVQWWDGDDKPPLDFCFPTSINGESEFGFEDFIEVFNGDFILAGGVSNGGKTAIVLNILARNLDLFGTKPLLMGSEYTAADGKITPRFKRRMGKMDVEWVNGNGPRFDLKPVGSDYEDYIRKDALNIIDWIRLPDNFWQIDAIMKRAKDQVGDGLVVGVLQKDRGKEFAEGGERIERYADVYLKIDFYGTESMLTLGKVKSSKGRATGRSWAFSIVDYGANLHNIREVVRCSKCWGKGYLRSGQNYVKCDLCGGLKFIDKG